MKKLIAAIALTLCFSSAAMATEWKMNRNGVATSPAKGAGVGAMGFADEGFTYVSFTFFAQCWPSTYKREELNIIVDGVAVKMESSCNDGSKLITWDPMTIKGNEYIIGTLSKKSTVNVDGKVLSANGFNKIHRMLTLKSLGGI